ncbi:hypothetical protein EVAR_89974_1 [Eumeta japonica]|uniref:Uncharacterized protein n=1 Tax=Eumeta variegata TaxID=151549 RepID=A0A4C2ADT1_EUMVA|nr:hypothetical protein EVAR_89974_1 [Eumeta japonica]
MTVKGRLQRPPIVGWVATLSGPFPRPLCWSGLGRAPLAQHAKVLAKGVEGFGGVEVSPHRGNEFSLKTIYSATYLTTRRGGVLVRTCKSAWYALQKTERPAALQRHRTGTAAHRFLPGAAGHMEVW